MTNYAKNIIAIIPARGGSKRLPHKNLMTVGGVPLIAHSIRHGLEATLVTEVVVSTDSAKIAKIASDLGASVVNRPKELSDDIASSESALLHVLDERNSEGIPDPDLIVFLQCTSPVRRQNDIDKAVETFLATGADSLFSACDNKRLIWGKSHKKGLKSITYDYKTRQREQEMKNQFYENGSIYIFPPTLLREENNRLTGHIEVHKMDLWTSFQLDEDEDVELLNWILRRPEFCTPPQWPEVIELVVFDFDGVMTDNSVCVSQDGKESVICNRGDGLGIDALRNAGVPSIILSSEKNEVVHARADKLQIPCIHGIADKAVALKNILSERDISPENVIFLGNDINDIGCFNIVGVAIAVADAHPTAASAADLILSKKGGGGAVRELCDIVIAKLKR